MKSAMGASGGTAHANRNCQLRAEDVGIASLNAGKASGLRHQNVVAANLLRGRAVPGKNVWLKLSMTVASSTGLKQLKKKKRDLWFIQTSKCYFQQLFPMRYNFVTCSKI
jgi:hypothetical protein